MRALEPALAPRVRLHNGPAGIIEEHGVTAELERALRSKVWLPSGGYIVINQTEALVAIDVNTGRFVGKNHLEETLLKTNLDAVREIVRQIRLRDLGGIIVVDFIDMEERKSRREVMRALEQELRRDRSPTKLLSVNEFGLAILTRKRVKQSLERLLMQPCPYCSGSGKVKSVATVCSEIYDEVRTLAADVRGQRLVLRVNPEVARALGGEEAAVLKALAELVARRGHASGRPAAAPGAVRRGGGVSGGAGAPRDEALVAFVEAIEAVLRARRGADHVLAPRDFALARGWYEAGVPLATVLVAIDLAFETDPGTTSLAVLRRRVEELAALGPRPEGASRETERLSLPELAERLAALRERLLELPGRVAAQPLAELAEVADLVAVASRPNWDYLRRTCAASTSWSPRPPSRRSLPRTRARCGSGRALRRAPPRPGRRPLARRGGRPLRAPARPGEAAAAARFALLIST